MPTNTYLPSVRSRTGKRGLLRLNAAAAPRNRIDARLSRSERRGNFEHDRVDTNVRPRKLIIFRIWRNLLRACVCGEGVTRIS